MHTIDQGQVTQDNGTAAHSAMSPNARTACHTSATGHRRMRTNVNVMTNLHQIVELDPVFQNRIFQCAPVDATVGTDFYIIAYTHCPELLNLFPNTLVLRKTETVSANDNTRMQDAAITHNAIFAHSHTRFQL